MDDIIYDSDGNIDWNANGWPEPNPGAETDDGEYCIDGMPDDIYDMWMDMCDEMFDVWEME